MATKFDTLVEGREVPVPSYTPENKYIEETVDHDGVTFYTTFWVSVSFSLCDGLYTCSNTVGDEAYSEG